jgi:hypothetical protein
VLIFYIILVVAAIVAAFFAVRAGFNLTFTGVGLIVLMLVPLPVYAISMNIAKNSAETYHQYYNGFETSAYDTPVTCERDGSCVNTYQCDPYTVTVYVEVEDADGKGTHEEAEQETRYHDCPYSTQETSYYVDTTLGQYTIASNLMTGGPWDSGTAIPGGQITKPPVFWSNVKARIDAGTPGGVTQVNDYDNFILSSETTSLKKYSAQIAQFKKAKLLPAVASGTVSWYKSDKAAFVGNVYGINKASIQKHLLALNGAVGTELQGDVRMVFVNANKVQDPQTYADALRAYWEDGNTFGKDALAKNAIVIVVGVNSATKAEWVRSFTGMPVGNEAMIQDLNDQLLNVKINANFIGSPTYSVASKSIVHSNGAVENILFGVDKFQRVSMSAKDKSDHGTGFVYLSDEWEPNTGDWIAFFIWAGAIDLVLGVVFFFITKYASDQEVSDPVDTFIDVIIKKTPNNRKNYNPYE